MTQNWFLGLIYLMIPAYVANMAPPFVKFWPGWNRPINRRWLGDHKTVTGFAFGVVLGFVAAFFQSRIGWIETLWPRSSWIYVGLASGFGAMIGDAVKSFFKRLLGIAPGKSWIPADQLDFPIGALVLLFPIVTLKWLDIIVILGTTFVADVAVNHIAFWLRIRDTAW